MLRQATYYTAFCLIIGITMPSCNQDIHHREENNAIIIKDNDDLWRGREKNVIIEGITKKTISKPGEQVLLVSTNRSPVIIKPYGKSWPPDVDTNFQENHKLKLSGTLTVINPTEPPYDPIDRLSFQHAFQRDPEYYLVHWTVLEK